MTHLFNKTYCAIFLAFIPLFAMGKSFGTGFYISKDGYIATNYHVIEGQKSLTVIDFSGNAKIAKVHRTDIANDLAILKVNSSEHNYLKIANSNTVQKGLTVFTMGFPNPSMQGFQESKLTDGTVSSLSGVQGQPNTFQISVPVQPGNSGGALLTTSGAVVGIIVAKLALQPALEATGSIPENVNYAVKSNYLLELMRVSKVPFQEYKGRLTSSSSMTSLAAESEKAVVLIVGDSQDSHLTKDNAPLNEDPNQRKPEGTPLLAVFVDTKKLMNVSKDISVLNQKLKNFAQTLQLDLITQKAFSLDEVNATGAFINYFDKGAIPSIDRKSFLRKVAYLDYKTTLEKASPYLKRAPLATDKMYDNYRQNEIKKAIKMVMRSQGIQLVFVEAVYVKDSLNITKDVISQVRVNSL